MQGVIRSIDSTLVGWLVTEVFCRMLVHIVVVEVVLNLRMSLTVEIVACLCEMTYHEVHLLLILQELLPWPIEQGFLNLESKLLEEVDLLVI